ncbi:uncharacterized protein ACWYII_007451 [Salvelinus alpinus]
MEVVYPPDIKTEKAKKSFKGLLMGQNHECLFADLTSCKTRANLIFNTKRGHIWKRVICNHFPFSKKRGISQGCQISIFEEADHSNTYQTVNVYNNGTVLIQGNDSSLQAFENRFTTLKAEAEIISETEEKVKEGDDGEKQAPAVSVTQQEALSVPLPTSPAADRAKDMPTTPRTPAMQRFHNTLSLVEAEVIELRENMLQEEDTVQKLKEEMKQFKEESRASIAKLESRMDKLSQTNDDLRDHLSTTRKQLEQRERYIDLLNQQRVIMSSASGEHVHQLGITQAEPETSMASTTQPDDTAPAYQSAPAQVSQPASQSAPAQVRIPVSQSAPAQVRIPVSQSAPAQCAPAQVNLPASQSASQSAPTQCAPAKVRIPSSQSAPARQSPTTAILIDSNGKFLVQERLFPRHQVYKFWCPTTDSAMQLLSQTRIDTLDNIIIHTGTNDLHAKGEDVSGAVRRVAERAQAVFPTTNIVVSTLLPRKDFPGQLIDKINQQITVDCASLLNVRTAHHPTLTCQHLYDDVHLDQDSVRTFAKDLKDATLGRDPHTHHPSNRGPPPHLLKQQYLHHPQEKRARHGLLQHSSTRPGPTQHRFTRPGPSQHSSTRPGPSQHRFTRPDPHQDNTTRPGPTQHSSTRPGPSQHSSTRPGPSQHSSTGPGPSQHSSTGPGPSEHSSTRPGPSQHRFTRPDPSQDSTTRPGPSQHSSTRPGPSQHSSTRPGPSQHSSTGPGPSQHSSTGPGPSEHSSTGPGPSQHISTRPGPSQHISTRPGPSQHSSTGPGPSQHISTGPGPSQHSSDHYSRVGQNTVLQRSTPHDAVHTMYHSDHQPTYAEVTSGKRHLEQSEIGEVRQLLQLICRLLG